MDIATVQRVEVEDRDEVVTVLRWRFRSLVESGYDLDQAAVLASHPQIDLHRAAELIERGCPPETAVRILV